MNIQKLMKQAQAMQKKMEEQQKELEKKEYEGTSGGGMVTATVSGSGDLKSLKIDPSLLGEPDDAEMLEDLIIAAYKLAKKDANDESGSTMSDMMGGMGLPAGFKLPF